VSVSVRATALAVLLILLASLRPAAAAQVPDANGAIEAKQLLQQGLELWKEKQYVEALDRFRESNRRLQSSGALINAALCLLKLGRKFEAFEALDEGLRLPDAITNRKELEGLLRKTRDELPRLIVKVSEAGADVLVDGRAVGQSPLPGHIVISPGEHTVSGSKIGFESVTLTVQIPDRDRHESQILLPLTRSPSAANETEETKETKETKETPPKLPEAVPPPAAPVAIVRAIPPPPETQSAQHGRSRWKVAAIGSAAVSVGAFATGTVFAVRAKSQFGTAEDHCKPDCDPTGKAANANAFSNADHATFAAVVGGVALAAAIVFWLVGR